MLIPALIALALLAIAPRAYSEGCGITPIKPIPPIGCKDLAPVCQCDERGQRCHWGWVCVK
jgi:hypothetical protein